MALGTPSVNSREEPSSTEEGIWSKTKIGKLPYILSSPVHLLQWKTASYVMHSASSLAGLRALPMLIKLISNANWVGPRLGCDCPKMLGLPLGVANTRTLLFPWNGPYMVTLTQVDIGKSTPKINSKVKVSKSFLVVVPVSGTLN